MNNQLNSCNQCNSYIGSKDSNENNPYIFSTTLSDDQPYGYENSDLKNF